MFYALFCFKQLKIDPEKVFMSCSGVINLKSSLYLLLYKYVRNIKIIDLHEDESNNILFSVKRWESFLVNLGVENLLSKEQNEICRLQVENMII